MADDDLTGLAVDVDPRRVNALLLSRTPSIVDEGSVDHDLFNVILTGVAFEVTKVVGTNPVGEVRDLALWCISLGVASYIESAMFPEQQLGGDARANQLLARYLGVLSELRGSPTGTDSSGPALFGSLPPLQPRTEAIIYAPIWAPQ